MNAFRFFISSVQDEFAEERRRLKEWLTTDLFVSRFVESVFLFEDEPSRGKPPREVFLEEARASDIYIGLVGTQYYGKTSVKRGVSATEQEYDAAGTGDCERWVYLKAVDKRDKKASAFVSRVNRDVTRTLFVTFDDLKSAVYASFVSFLDRRELIDVGDFDKSVCREMTWKDVDRGRVKWYLNEMRFRKQKAALPLSTKPADLFTQLGIMHGKRFTWAAALCFAKNPQRWCYRATLKCCWNEGTEFGRPFLDTDKFEGNLFELQKLGTDFVMSRIAQSRGLRTTGMVAPVQWDIPREAVEEALVNALVHRNWRYSSSVEVRLFADRLEIWTPGKLAEGLTIEKLYKTHSSYPVNDLVLKVFDFAGIIESLGTGIKRIIDACRKNGNPSPKFEQDGATFIVTLRKRIAVDAKKPTGNHQKNCPINCPLNGPLKLLEAIRQNPGLRKSRLAELCDLTARTVKFYIENELASKIEYRGSKKTGGYYATEPVEGEAVLMDSETINEGINEVIKEAIKSNPGIKKHILVKAVGKSRATVERALADLVAAHVVEHRGSKKTGGYYLVTEGLREAGEGAERR